ncbi:glycoside-pentoside-hexuronide (GPH):cation symporter [Altererythrobacter arenosus]|uniref:Glycoside-pentoside-hexuronide (GPH):cation symporter n=1 Tax=Altererythrobacter arenosus TaxID=3032592 RepID=A0ABY8FNJ5_9SPHN|nr:glycoside-pentoside-hexuronide (GPH):cation symporter [Altererythrobacter sp. CAU 1644]WFL76588.1 glycoside-pentoside-hexuronide (GPH):cation symporter [Altererythrobacter sp. CAU 1644]
MTARAADRVGRGEKLAYGLGELASSLYVHFFGFFLLFFFVDLGGLAPAAVGLMLLLTKLIDAVTDPMMGVIADRTRTRWGRYRPYLLWGAVPFGVTGAMIFAAPEMSKGALLAWAYVTYTLTMLAYTVVNVPYSGLLGSISPSSSERASTTAYRMVFSSVALISIGLFGTTLVRVFGQGDEARGISMTMFVIAALAVVCILITFSATRERVPPARDNGTVSGDLLALIRTPAWLIVATAATLAPVAIAARAGSALFFFKYVVRDNGLPVFLFFDRVALFYTALALGQVTGVILANYLQRRFEKHHLIIWAGAIKATAILVFYVIPLDAVWPQTIAQSFVGLGFGMMLVMAYAMFTDIAEYVEWRSGRQMTGLVVSASIFATKAGIALGSALPGFAFALTGFVAGEVQSEEAVAGINLAFALIPIMAILPAGIAMMFYRIDRAMIATAEAELAQRRASAV